MEMEIDRNRGNAGNEKPGEDLRESISSANWLEEEPKDEGSVVYFIIFLFGIGYLIAWKSILSAMDYLVASVSNLIVFILHRCLITVLKVCIHSACSSRSSVHSFGSLFTACATRFNAELLSATSVKDL